jgi:1,4-dihydroxy-6-naphthoate synthase
VHQISLGYSPCPNDTFIFHALATGLTSVEDVRFTIRLEDVETLNRLALQGEIDVTKVSYGAVPLLLDRYALLRSGGALGRGCGPLLVARRPLETEELHQARIAVPGRMTTANLLLRLFEPELPPGREMVYSDIMPAVERGEVDAGLIIHESRFTYPDHGLVKVVDLGEWWERETGTPIPLGGIVARRSLGEALIHRIEAGIRASVEHALRHPAASAAYVTAHAQEMDPAVMQQHIDLYVNDFSVDVGAEGERAIEELLRRSGAITRAPASSEPEP